MLQATLRLWIGQRYCTTLSKLWPRVVCFPAVFTCVTPAEVHISPSHAPTQPPSVFQNKFYTFRYLTTEGASNEQICSCFSIVSAMLTWMLVNQPHSVSHETRCLRLHKTTRPKSAPSHGGQYGLLPNPPRSTRVMTSPAAVVSTVVTHTTTRTRVSPQAKNKAQKGIH